MKFIIVNIIFLLCMSLISCANVADFESIGDTALNSDSEFQDNVNQETHKDVDEKSPDNIQDATSADDSQDKAQSQGGDLNLSRKGVTLEGYDEYIQYIGTHQLPNHFVNVNVINDNEEIQLKYTRIDSDGLYAYSFISDELEEGLMVIVLPQGKLDVSAHEIDIPEDFDDLRETYCWGYCEWHIDLQGITYKYYADSNGFGRLHEFSFYVDDILFIWRFPTGISVDAFQKENTFISKMLDAKTALTAYAEFSTIFRSETE